MKLKEIDVYLIQETWLEGDVYDETINGYHVFRHNGGVLDIVIGHGILVGRLSC